MGTEKIKMTFEKIVELQQLIGDDATLWEIGFITRYVKLQEEENSALSMEQHVKQAKKFMLSMLNLGLVVDRSEEIAEKIFPEKFYRQFSEKTIIADESTTICQYVDHIGTKIIENEKNDGKHVASFACGDTKLNGKAYEIRVVLEPRKDLWLGDEGEVDFLKVG